MDNVMIRHAFAKGILSVFIAVFVAGMALAIMPLTTAQADTTFNVNSTADTVDANLGDGTCADATGACTLRAIRQLRTEDSGPGGPGSNPGSPANRRGSIVNCAWWQRAPYFIPY